ncbi:ABC transporter ATP-binding protein [Microbulbifer mangrovi]|uniref:ABC transporter ATP-binding protein n=1 Tax=Microbulbifer mangrovi TaxID=927787 RepID=UPI001958DE57|nr:ATP-binding cassette domain-containing protein [Microbulbifer mangrovi]
MAEQSTSGLVLRGLSVGELEATDLQIATGEIVCLSGPSGCGKSRLLRAIADLEPHCGSVLLGKQAQADLPAHQWRKAVMMVPAESHWWFETVGEHFHHDQQDALRALGISPQAFEWPVARLSSGEKQRLAVLRALQYKPHALLLDEPTANLDEDSTMQVEQWLCNQIRERLLPVLWVAHREDQIQRVADRHFHIEDRRLQPRELKP